jgi:hypothetical protein
MRYRDDPILKAKADGQRTQGPQPGVKRRRYLPDVLWYRYERQTDRPAPRARWVLGLVVVLLIVVGIGGYLLVNR